MHDIKGKWNTLKLTGLPRGRCCCYNNVDFDMTGDIMTILIQALSLCKITIGMNYWAG